jgi:hypothetical protein
VSAFLFLLSSPSQAWIIEYTVKGDLFCQDCVDDRYGIDGAHYEAVYWFDNSESPSYARIGTDSSFALYDAVSVQITIDADGGPLEFSLDSAEGNAQNNYSPFNPSEDAFSIQIAPIFTDPVNVTPPMPIARFDNSFYGVEVVPGLPIFGEGNLVPCDICFPILHVGLEKYALINWTFEVTSAPPDPIQAIQDLVKEVIILNLGQGIQNSLDGKLDSAISALEDVNENNDVGAINKLDAFIHHVEAQWENMIPEDDAARLIAMARDIIQILESE